MPTNRTRRRRAAVGGLTAPERHLLLTGDCTPPRGSWRDRGESVFRTFTLVSPAGRRELRALWERYRDELMAEWQKQRRPGLPWAARQFDHAPQAAEA